MLSKQAATKKLKTLDTQYVNTQIFPPITNSYTKNRMKQQQKQKKPADQEVRKQIREEIQPIENLKKGRTFFTKEIKLKNKSTSKVQV